MGSKVTDEDDDVLTPEGHKIKRVSWQQFILLRGRIDDDPQLVEDLGVDDKDPRIPSMRIKIFWRLLGEKACIERDKAESGSWKFKFIRMVWKDTPSRWPKP